MGAIEDIKSRLEKEATEQYTVSIMTGLLEICEKDADFTNIMHDSERKLTECFNYIKSLAQKQAKNGCAMISNEVVYGWAKDFYMMSEEDYKKLCTPATKKDNVVEIPKQVSTDEEETEEELEEPKKVIKVSERDTTIKTKSEKKSKPDDLPGQMNILDFLG